MKLFDCLPNTLTVALHNVTNVREIRVRNGRAVKVNVGGQWYFVGSKGLVQAANMAVTLGNVCDDIVRKACNNSVYAYEKMLAKGFFTLEDGVRVGVCGSVAGSNEAVFQKYTSLCLRVPHHVNLVDDYTLGKCNKGNVVVIGPPCSGKTTFLRDLSIKLSRTYNVLVVDERGELFYDDKLIEKTNCDVLKWTSKEYAFETGIRAMSPEWFVCDELTTDDIDSVKSCVSSGVHIACSVHGFNLEDFANKFGLKDYFSTVIVLGRINTPITIIDLKSQIIVKNEKL